VATLLTLEQREWETSIQENTYWHDTLVSGYKSRTYHLVHCLLALASLSQHSFTSALLSSGQGSQR
jgi:hypothetical protein